MDNIRFGIVGLGNMGRAHRKNILAGKITGIELTAVCAIPKGLPEKRLYISQKARNTLLKDLPENIRKWQRAFLLSPEGKLWKVKVRHRGDNPVNWAYNKKSWRVKLKKKMLINKTRTFDYIVPQEGNQFNTYFAYHIGRLAGVLSLICYRRTKKN